LKGSELTKNNKDKNFIRIAGEVEADRTSFLDTPYLLDNKVTAYLAKSAVKASMRLNTRAIVADSISGQTILAIAAYRGDNPIYAQIYDEQVMRVMALSFGVFPDFIERRDFDADPIKKAIQRLVDQGKFEVGDLITVLAGHFGCDHGASYIEISTAESMIPRVL